MPDLASLSFDIDSSQAQRAIGVLDALKASSISVTTASGQLKQNATDLAQAYSQQRDQLVRLADQTKTYDGTLSGLVNRLNAMRNGVAGAQAAFQSYATTLNLATTAATQFNATVDGLDRYVAKAQQLRLTISDLATGLDRVTAALRQQTLEGAQTRVMFDQLGISTAGINANRPDLVLQQISDRLRQFSDPFQRLQAGQRILGPSFDATASQQLANQPFQPYWARVAQQRAADQAAQIDAQQAALQQATIRYQRLEAERLDNQARFTTNPTWAGRLFGFEPPFDRSAEQQRQELARIAALPLSQQGAYTRYGEQIRQNIEQSPVTGIVRNITSGTFASNQAEIFQQAAEAARTSRVGILGGVLPFIGGTAQNLFGGYTPQPQVAAPLTEYERLQRSQQNAQLFGAYDDQSLTRILQAQQQLQGLTGGRTTTTTVTPGTGILGATLAPNAGAIARYGIFGERLGDIQPERTRTTTTASDAQQKYITEFGPAEGIRRYANTLAGAQQNVLYAREPERQQQDETARQAYLLSLAPEQRAQAGFLLQRLPQGQNVPFAGAPADWAAGRTSLRPGEVQANIGVFRQQIGGQLQGQAEDVSRQIGFQRDLTASLEHGRAAAEDFTRAWQSYTQASLSGATADQSNKAALDALNLALTQRLTQGKALVEHLREENALTAEQQRATGAVIGADVQTRRASEIQASIAADRERLSGSGQLPDPAGGRWAERDAQGRLTGQVRTLDAPGAQRVLDQYTEARQQQVGQEGVAAGAALSNAIADQARDAQRLVDIMREQGTSLEHAQELLGTEKALREAIAKAAADTSGALQRQLETERLNTAELQRQADVAGTIARNLDTIRGMQISAVTTAALAGARPEDREALRRALPVIISNATAGGAPIAPPAISPQLNQRAQIEMQTVQRGLGLSVTGAAGVASGGAAETGLVPQAEDRRLLQGPNDQGGLGTYQWTASRRLQFLDYTRRNQMDPSDPATSRGFLMEDLQQSRYAPLLRQLRDPNVSAQQQAAAFTSQYLGAPSRFAEHVGYADRFAAAAAGSPPAVAPVGAGRPGPTPANAALLNQQAATNTGALSTAETGVAAERTLALQEQNEQLQARLDLYRRQLALAGRPGAQAAEQMLDPNLPRGIAIQQAQIRQTGMLGEQQVQQANVSAQTISQTQDLTRETQALNMGYRDGEAALKQVDAQIQAHNEAMAKMPGVVNEVTRAQELMNRSFAETQRAMAGATVEAQKSQEVQRALLAAGPFASDLDLARIRRDTELQQKFRATPGLEQSPAGQQAIATNQQQTELDKAQQSMNDLRDAGKEAASAIGEAFTAAVDRSKTARGAAMDLVKTLEDIALKTFVTKPFERAVQSVLGSLTGNTGDTGASGNGQATQGSQGPGLISRAFSWVSSLFTGDTGASPTTAGNAGGIAAANDNQGIAAANDNTAGTLGAAGGALGAANLALNPQASAAGAVPVWIVGSDAGIGGAGGGGGPGTGGGYIDSGTWDTGDGSGAGGGAAAAAGGGSGWAGALGLAGSVGGIASKALGGTSAGALAGAGGGILAALGKALSGGINSNTPDSQIGLLGKFVNLFGGSGFYQGGGLIGSLFGGGGSAAGTLTDSAVSGTAPGFFGSLFGGGGGLTQGPTAASDLVTSPFNDGSIDSGVFDSGALSDIGALFAKGAAFPGSKALHAYENQVISAPTVFRFAQGASVGVMGEAGAEAIMPLKRGADGRLGVAHHGAVGGGSPIIHNWNITTANADSFMATRRQIEGRYAQSMSRTSQRNSTGA